MINSVVRNNTLYHNARNPRVAGGEVWVQLGSGNTIENNLVVGRGRKPVLIRDENPAVTTPANSIDFNVYYADAARASPVFVFAGESLPTFADYVTASGREGSSLFAEPLLAAIDAEDFSLSSGSPAIDAGNPALSPATSEVDLPGRARVIASRVDVGAYESQ